MCFLSIKMYYTSKWAILQPIEAWNTQKMKNSLKVARQTYSLPILIIKLVFSYISQKGQRATEKIRKSKMLSYLIGWSQFSLSISILLSSWWLLQVLSLLSLLAICKWDWWMIEKRWKHSNAIWMLNSNTERKFKGFTSALVK